MVTALKKLKKLIRNSTPWRYLNRAGIALSYFKQPIRRLLGWIPLRTESDNFYYELTESNIRILASTISVVTNLPPQLIQKYLDEITNNENFKSQIRDFFREDSNMLDSNLGFGRRIGWYAVVRATKPKLVIETGVHHGIGASIICEALALNSREGSSGRYLGTDYDSNAGRLVKQNYPAIGTVLYGDSIASLEKITDEVDLFINDSDHDAEYEANEYLTITTKLSKRGIILGDNSHVTTELLEYSLKYSRKYLFFSEVPEDHWYPGGGIGFSFN
jgi:predicted O-methyltransferase YrrM